MNQFLENLNNIWTNKLVSKLSAQYPHTWPNHQTLQLISGHLSQYKDNLYYYLSVWILIHLSKRLIQVSGYWSRCSNIQPLVFSSFKIIYKAVHCLKMQTCTKCLLSRLLQPFIQIHFNGCPFLHYHLINASLYMVQKQCNKLLFAFLQDLNPFIHDLM